MNKFLKSGVTLAIALVGSLALTSPAHAFLLDGFGDDQGSVTADGSSTDGPMTISDTDFENAERTLTVERESGSNDVEMRVGDGQLQYSQGTQTFGEGTVDWESFTPVSFGSTANMLISIIEADNALGGVTLTLRSGGSEESVTADLPQVTFGSGPETLLVSLGGFSESLLASVDSASLMIDGREVSSLDASIDFIEVPAPGVLGLLGIGLAGIAFVARRRRDTDAAAV